MNNNENWINSLCHLKSVENEDIRSTNSNLGLLLILRSFSVEENVILILRMIYFLGKMHNTESLNYLWKSLLCLEYLWIQKLFYCYSLNSTVNTEK